MCLCLKSDKHCEAMRQTNGDDNALRQPQRQQVPANLNPKKEEEKVPAINRVCSYCFPPYVGFLNVDTAPL